MVNPLNECLLIGPKFNQKIFDILVRFCSYPIVLTADIEKVILTIAAEERDRDVLWVNNINMDSSILNVQLNLSTIPSD